MSDSGRWTGECEHGNLKGRCDKCRLAELEQTIASLREEKPKRFPILVDRGDPAPCRTVPWVMAEKAHAVYVRRGGGSATLERLAERGGFGWTEFACYYAGHADFHDAAKCQAARSGVDPVRLHIESIEAQVQQLTEEIASLREEKADALRRGTVAIEEKGAWEIAATGAEIRAGMAERARDEAWSKLAQAEAQVQQLTTTKEIASLQERPDLQRAWDAIMAEPTTPRQIGFLRAYASQLRQRHPWDIAETMASAIEGVADGLQAQVQQLTEDRDHAVRLASDAANDIIRLEEERDRLREENIWFRRGLAKLQQACRVESHVSRACEYGTLGCNKRHLATEARLREALQTIQTTVRGDEKQECWTIRKWLDDHDIFNDDLQGPERLIEEVCKALLVSGGGERT